MNMILYWIGQVQYPAIQNANHCLAMGVTSQPGGGGELTNTRAAARANIGEGGRHHGFQARQLLSHSEPGGEVATTMHERLWPFQQNIGEEVLAVSLAIP